LQQKALRSKNPFFLTVKKRPKKLFLAFRKKGFDEQSWSEKLDELKINLKL
jgi:hypothetical protein